MNKKSLINRVTLGTTVIVISGFMVALAANYILAVVQSSQTQEKLLANQLDLLSQSLETSLLSLDITTARLIADTYLASADVVSLKIVSTHDDSTVFDQQLATDADIYYGRKEIYHNDEMIGFVEIGLSGKRSSENLLRMLLFSIFVATFLLLALSAALRIMFRIYLQRPLDTLGFWTDRVASGQYDGALPEIDLFELDDLAKKFFNMSQVVRSREESLSVSKNRFRGLFENTEVSIWDEDLSAVAAALDELRRGGVEDLREHMAENPDCAWEMAAMVKVNRVNHATLKLFSAKDHEEMLHKIDKTFAPGSIDTFAEVLCAVWDREKSFSSEVSYLTFDGRLINTIISFNIPESIDGFRSVPIAIIDITDLKCAEAELVTYRDHLQTLVDEQTLKLRKAQEALLQQDRLATLGKLTATVSHELRNPLGTIKTSLYSIGETLGEHDSHRVVRSIELAERNIDRCVTIIEELNSYARERQLDCRECALDDWLDEIVDELHIPEDIELVKDFASDVQASFDPEKLRQVIVNLVNNAIDALRHDESSGKALKLSTRLRGERFEISVSDNGCGMTDDVREKIFEPLFSTKGFGIGLGMVIVKKIVEKHRGTIEVESQASKGCRVSVNLPVCCSSK